jgi:hypothetical protein
MRCRSLGWGLSVRKPSCLPAVQCSGCCCRRSARHSRRPVALVRRRAMAAWEPTANHGLCQGVSHCHPRGLGSLKPRASAAQPAHAPIATLGPRDDRLRIRGGGAGGQRGLKPLWRCATGGTSWHRGHGTARPGCLAAWSASGAHFKVWIPGWCEVPSQLHSHFATSAHSTLDHNLLRAAPISGLVRDIIEICNRKFEFPVTPRQPASGV